MRDFVPLSLKRSRGWPWPEDSFGLTPLFGEDGWCRSCGVPKHAQSGSLVLQRRNFKVRGAWVPYWYYDAICVEAALAERLGERFDLHLIDVDWHASSPGEAKQFIVPTVGERWFDPDELRERVASEHGTPGATCDECGVWRWLPLGFEPVPPIFELTLPPLCDIPELDDHDVAASPEWFGDGLNAFRQILIRRELASMIVDASPRDFRIAEPTWAS